MQFLVLDDESETNEAEDIIEQMHEAVDDGDSSSSKSSQSEGSSSSSSSEAGGCQ